MWMNCYLPIPSLMSRISFPSNPTVRAYIRRIAQVFRMNFYKDLMEVLEIGGGGSCDGLNQNVNGTEYYGFVAHHF